MSCLQWVALLLVATCAAAPDVGAASAAYDRGAAHAAAGRYDVAIGELLAALALAPAAGDAVADDVAASADFVLGWIYQRREEWHGAEVSYRRSLARRPGAPEALANLAVVLHKRGGAGDAAALLAEGAAALAPASDAFRRNAAALRAAAAAGDAPRRPATYACAPLPGDPRRRALPTLLIVSAPKTGSTALYADLAAHPNVAGGTCKETRFWPPRTRRGDRWDDAYRAYFPPIDEGWDVVVDGGGTYGMEASLGVAVDVAALMPAATVAVGALREPAERYLSVWVGLVTRSGLREPCAAFFDAARRERDACAAGRACDAAAASPAADGHYSRHVRSWADALGPDRTLWLPTSADDAAGLVFAFLGLGATGAAPSRAGSDNARAYRDPASARFFAARAGAAWRCDDAALEAFYRPLDLELLPELARSRAFAAPAVAAAWRRDAWFCARVGSCGRKGEL